MGWDAAEPTQFPGGKPFETAQLIGLGCTSNPPLFSITPTPFLPPQPCTRSTPSSRHWRTHLHSIQGHFRSQVRCRRQPDLSFGDDLHSSRESLRTARKIYEHQRQPDLGKSHAASKVLYGRNGEGCTIKGMGLEPAENPRSLPY